MKKQVIYLHGFNSAFKPGDEKLTQLASVVGSPLVGLTLDYTRVTESLATLDALVRDELDDPQNGEVIIVGTSLGGLFARYLASRHCIRSITFNPALRGADLAHYDGQEAQNWVTCVSYRVPSNFSKLLSTLNVSVIGAPNLTVVASDDEVINFDERVLGELNNQGQVVVTTGGHRLLKLDDNVVSELEKFINRDYLLDSHT